MSDYKKYYFSYMSIIILLLGITYTYTNLTSQKHDHRNNLLNKNKFMIKAQLKFSDKLVTVMIDTSNPVAKEFVKHMPINSIGHNIGGEVYFRTKGVDLEYDDTERSEFEMGDVTYWRSPTGEDKFAIAIFYGNTQFSNWKSPRASSPCVKIGKVIDNMEALKLAGADEDIIFSLE